MALDAGVQLYNFMETFYCCTVTQAKEFEPAAAGGQATDGAAGRAGQRRASVRGLQEPEPLLHRLQAPVRLSPLGHRDGMRTIHFNLI